MLAVLLDARFRPTAVGLKTGELGEVLRRAHRSPFALQSDFARANAPLVAYAASVGYLSSILPTGVPGTTWHITAAGLRHLETHGWQP